MAPGIANETRDHLPPALWLGFQDFWFFVNQCMLDPSSARKSLIQKVASCFFLPQTSKSPNRRRIQDNKEDKKIKSEKNKTPKKPEAENKKPQKVIAYRFAWKQRQFYGEGGFGKIYKAYCRVPSPSSTGGIWEDCAVKVIPISNTSSVIWNFITKLTSKYPADIDEARQELSILKKLQGEEFILELKIDLIRKGKFLIVTEICECGDLARVLAESPALPRHRYIEGRGVDNETPRFNISLMRFLIAPIFAALSHMHTVGYVHRDIKPQNILLCANGTPKLCDFGTAIRLQQPKNDADVSQVGSSYYMAPETICCEKFTETLDTWQLAITMLVLIYGWGPYHFRRKRVFWERSTEEGFTNADERHKTVVITEMFKQAYHSVRNIDTEIHGLLGLHRPLDSEPENVWLEFAEFVATMFTRSVDKRPTVTRLLEHEYIAESLNAWRTKDFSLFGEEKSTLEGVIRELPKRN